MPNLIEMENKLDYLMKMYAVAGTEWFPKESELEELEQEIDELAAEVEILSYEALEEQEAEFLNGTLYEDAEI